MCGCLLVCCRPHCRGRRVLPAGTCVRGGLCTGTALAPGTWGVAHRCRGLAQSTCARVRAWAYPNARLFRVWHPRTGACGGFAAELLRGCLRQLPCHGCGFHLIWCHSWPLGPSVSVSQGFSVCTFSGCAGDSLLARGRPSRPTVVPGGAAVTSWGSRGFF